MQSKIVLRARVPDGQGHFPFVNVEIKKGQPVAIDGATSYYLRYTKDGKRVDEAVGNDLQKAYLAYANRLLVLEHQKLGLPTPTVAQKVRGATEISSAIIKFLENKEILDVAPNTLYQYRKVLRDFRQSCKKTDLAQIDRDDIMQYIKWIRENKPKHKIRGKLDGDRNTTVRKELRCLRVFLLHFVSEFPLPEKEWPKIPYKNPDRYSLEEHVQKMLDVATEDEKDLIHFMLCTGFRDREAAHATYGDIKRNGSINVANKPEYGFKLKTQKPRTVDIPLPSWLITRLKARQERYKTELIFPNREGRPSLHLLNSIKWIAKRAGLTCYISLHKFRRTFGTLMAKKFGLRQAQAMLGHSKIETTMAYLSADEMDTAEARQGVEEVFSSVGD